jgi:hypothetical protein
LISRNAHQAQLIDSPRAHFGVSANRQSGASGTPRVYGSLDRILVAATQATQAHALDFWQL